MATLSGIGEIVLPILLVLGLGTRFAAIGILLMTAVRRRLSAGGLRYHVSVGPPRIPLYSLP